MIVNDRRNCKGHGSKQLLPVGFEVFTAVVLKSIFFWDMTPCTALSGTRRVGGTSGTTQRTTRRHITEEDTLQLLPALGQGSLGQIGKMPEELQSGWVTVGLMTNIRTRHLTNKKQESVLSVAMFGEQRTKGNVGLHLTLLIYFTDEVV
jgi:hypothetical protein